MEACMPAMSRREFFKKTATDTAVAGLLAAGAGAMLEANPLGLPIGSQTYPHRQMIKDGDFAGLLKTLKDIGVERSNCARRSATPSSPPSPMRSRSKKILADHGMKCESAHFSMRELRENQQKSIAWAQGRSASRR